MLTTSSTTNGIMAESQSRFLEMKSVQPYSTTDEYIYAMKEDLADWLSNMYPEWRPITAENFLECLGKTCLTYVDLSLFDKANVLCLRKRSRDFALIRHKLSALENRRISSFSQ